jgi:secreted trypsin-like serine protease
MTKWALTLLLLSCRGEPDAAVADPIIGGRLDRRHGAVGLVGRIDGEEITFHCSGTLIGPSTVLTAAHCLYDADGRRIRAPRLAFGTDADIHEIGRSYVAPSYAPGASDGWDDAAILRLREPSDVPPIPFSETAPNDAIPAVVVGYGVTDGARRTGFGRRRSAEIELDAISGREIFYDARRRGSCFGDSGGPILQDLGEGEVVAGVTSRGTNATCTGIDIATRADVLASWIRSKLSPSPSSGE